MIVSRGSEAPEIKKPYQIVIRFFYLKFNKGDKKSIPLGNSKHCALFYLKFENYLPFQIFGR